VEVLAESLPGLVLELPFPKVMRWAASDLQYARPLHWVVALLDRQVIPLRLGELAAGCESRGHRTLARNSKVRLDGAARYLDLMHACHVLVDPEARRQRIEAGMTAALADLPRQAGWRPDEELMTEVVHLCEFPTPFLGSYSEEFFELPAEVIVTALKAHQRYFAVVDRHSGDLLPYFLAVRDGGECGLATVRRGNERVLRARLADALFYWRFDQQRQPDEQVLQLGSVTWIEGFGSLLDKTRRLERLVELLWQMGYGDEGPVPAAVQRAAALCKSDLVSEMIKDGKEFTRLEGVIGAHYARLAGESEEVCRAIERHYLPRGADPELPGDAVSSVLAVADRLDTLAGCWLAGLIPTGAKDPYGLRRHALALLRITIDRRARIHLPDLLDAAAAPFASCLPQQDLSQPLGQLGDFIQRRLAGHLVETLPAQPEVVRAILPAHGDDPTDAADWARALSGFRNQADFLLLATGFKRCKNILEGKFLSREELLGCQERWLAGGRSAQGESFSQLVEPAERDLLALISSGAAELMAAQQRSDYVAVFQKLSSFGPAIDYFFDTVRINAEQPGLRRLRHAFLREIHGLFVRYADFSEVAPMD
jgi:glycyl-tRNA synthetase beta chain